MTIRYSDFSLREQVRLMHTSNFISSDAQLTEEETEDLFKEWLDQVNRVVSIFVGKYRKFSNAVFNEDDLFDEAWAVILRNMGNYDPAKADFANYISTILSHELHDYVNDCRSFFHLSSDTKAKIAKIKKIQKSDLGRFGGEDQASIEELAKKCDMDAEDVKSYLDTDKATTSVLSLNRSTVDEDSDFIEMVVDEGAAFEELIESQYNMEVLLHLIETSLSEREAAVIKCKYGLKDGEFHSDDEVASIIGLNSRQHVNSILHSAYKKLKWALTGPRAA